MPNGPQGYSEAEFRMTGMRSAMKMIVNIVAIFLIYIVGTLVYLSLESSYAHHQGFIVNPYIVQIVTFFFIGYLSGKGQGIRYSKTYKTVRLTIAVIFALLTILPLVPIYAISRLSVWIVRSHSDIFFSLALGYILSTNRQIKATQGADCGKEDTQQ